MPPIQTTRMPNFLVIGAPKCGTTSLCSLLARHPEVFMCDPKEPRFFSHDEFYNLGLNWYQSLFSEATTEKAAGEGSTSYSVSTRDRISAKRIFRHIPDAKLIYCVRHPLRRIESIWMEHHFSRYSCHPDFSDGTVSVDFNEDVWLNPAFVETSCYYSRLSVYREYFSEKQIHIVFLEDRIVKPAEILAGVFSFLRVTPDLEVKDVERPIHVSKERMLLNRLGRAFRKVPGYSRWYSLIPLSIRRGLAPLFTYKFERRPIWLPRVHEHVLDQINEDVRDFLKYCNKPSDFWSFDAGYNSSTGPRFSAVHSRNP